MDEGTSDQLGNSSKLQEQEKNEQSSQQQQQPSNEQLPSQQQLASSSSTINSPPPSSQQQSTTQSLPISQDTTTSTKPADDVPSSQNKPSEETPQQQGQNQQQQGQNQQQQGQNQQQQGPQTVTKNNILEAIEEFDSSIPDAVVHHFLNVAGMQTSDQRIIRLIAIAAQKFIHDIVSDSLQHCKLRGTLGKKTKEKKFTLAVEDLSAALAEYGIEVRRQHYFN